MSLRTAVRKTCRRRGCGLSIKSRSEQKMRAATEKRSGKPGATGQETGVGRVSEGDYPEDLQTQLHTQLHTQPQRHRSRVGSDITLGTSAPETWGSSSRTATKRGGKK